MNLFEIYNKLKTSTTPLAFLVNGPSNNIISIPTDSVGLLNVYCGSWNPLHAAHTSLYRSFKPCYFELSINIRDKDSITYNDLERRYEQFYTPIIITNAVYFKDKITAIKSLFPRRGLLRFYIGADTATRILRDHTKEEIEEYNASFLVIDRDNMISKTLSQEYVATNCKFLKKNLPENFEILDIKLPEYLNNISSTKIRSNL